jgi:hypothetical protein
MKLKMRFPKLFSLLVILALFSCEKDPPVSQEPMKASVLPFSHQEILKYTQTKASEKLGEFFVSIEKEKKSIYANAYFIYFPAGKTNTFNPSIQGNYPVSVRVCLTNGSLEKYRQSGNLNESNRSKSASILNYYQWDRKENVFFHQEILWNGKSFKTNESQTPLGGGFPIWELESFFSFGIQFLDVKSGGLVALFHPYWIKGFVPIGFRVAGKESIKTKIGIFPVVKVKFFLPKPLQADWLDRYSKDFTLWVEEGNSSRIIKAELPDGVVNLLEEKTDY